MSESEGIDKGIFLVEKGQFSTSEISITIDNEGNIQASSPQIKMRFDVCPAWLDIAIKHLLDTKNAAFDIQEARNTKNNNELATALKNEMNSGMQAIVSSCVAMEAFYDSVEKLSEVPKATQNAWRKNRTPKYARMSETFKVAFKIKNEETAKIRTAIKDCFSFRDKAVHPSQEYEFPAIHTELNKAVDLKFVLFRYNNAKNITQAMLSIIHQFSKLRKLKDPEILKYVTDLEERLEPIVDKWNSEFGLLVHKKT